MKYFILALTFLALTATQPVIAAPSCDTPIEVKIHGMVCDFCARAMEKVFGKREEVKDIQVNLDEGIVRIEMVEGGHINNATLRQLITDSGYDVANIERGC